MLKFLFLAMTFSVFLWRLLVLPQLELKEGQLVRVSGTLSEEPQIIGNYQKLKMGQIEVWTERYPDYHYGDNLEVVGKVKVNLVRRGLSRLKRKSYLLSYPKIRKIAMGGGANTLNLIKKMTETKLKLKSLFSRSLPAPLDGLLAGIVLGDKSLLPVDFWRLLQKTGTLHLLVASGMNVGFLGEGIIFVLVFLFKRRMAILIAIVLIWIYSLMIGLTPPITRASTLITLIYLGSISGKEGERKRLLWLTGFILVMIFPEWLFDLGFQLSFLATAGLVYLQPKLMEINFFLFKNSSFSVTLAALMATLPVLMNSFGQFNLLSPLVNLLVLWTVPLTLATGVIAGLTGLVWENLGKAIIFLIYPLLFYLQKVIEFFANIDFMIIQGLKIPFFLNLFYYFILYLWSSKKRAWADG